MPFIEGIRGAEPLRWCACGEHILELVGQFVIGRPSLADGSGEYTYEYSHMPRCAVCVDKIRTGELVLDDPVGAGVAGVLG